MRQAFLLSRQAGIISSLVGRRSRGIRGGPSRERPRAGLPAPPRDYAGRSECAGPSTSQALLVVRPSDGLDSPGWPAQLRDAVGHPGTLNAGPPVRLRATRRRPHPPGGQHHRKQCGVTRIVNRWTAQLQIAVVHLGCLSQRRPSESIPRAGAGPGCEATRPETAQAVGTKRTWQVGVQVQPGQGAPATSLAVLMGRAQQVSFSPSLTSSYQRARLAEPRQLMAGET